MRKLALKQELEKNISGEKQFIGKKPGLVYKRILPFMYRRLISPRDTS